MTIHPSLMTQRNVAVVNGMRIMPLGFVIKL
jgi:hypothetical protein